MMTNTITGKAASSGEKPTANRIVICCGGYLDGLYKPLARASLPIATYVMVTEPLGDRRDEAFNCMHAIYDTRFAFDYYRPLLDGRIMWGGRVSTSSDEPKDLADLLYQDLLRVYPQLKGTRARRYEQAQQLALNCDVQFGKMRVRCTMMVLGMLPSDRAIAFEECPFNTSRAISASRGLRREVTNCSYILSRRHPSLAKARLGLLSGPAIQHSSCTVFSHFKPKCLEAER